MIVCKIEMWPGGDEHHPRKRELGRVIITNVGGNGQFGNYSVVIPKSGEYARRPGVWKSGAVAAFPRTRLGPQDLLFRALAVTVGTRSPDVLAQFGGVLADVEGEGAA